MRIAIDWGKARIGVAASDRDAILAFPVETVQTANRPVQRLAEIIAEYEPVEVIMGLPVALDGAEQIAARDVREAGRQLAQAISPIPVRWVDERMTTRMAARALHDAGRNARKQRGVIDQAAAVAILEHVLEQIRSARSGMTTGEADS
ncbi:Holliday junction resolvase RuvX [Cutibacterium equinum]|uniref:Putative pre-16S rRNA nuclease n=1 Tax=Cutibacterium equinum TaxID=3016342 RepID=A0ABY7R0U9_9ACTN|nr:Holliday junction resolvase RuvX [Cutibacterium equinum]WCC80866.1 Holliday junction resolvase RuvX [Cutibacterium equinum]